MTRQESLWGRYGKYNQIRLAREDQDPSIPLPLGSSVLPGNANHVEGLTADELAEILKNQRGTGFEILDNGSQIIVRERGS